MRLWQALASLICIIAVLAGSTLWPFAIIALIIQGWALRDILH